jgi:hypothetical protein
MVRYIDDFLLCFQYRADALRVQDALVKRLTRFSLTSVPTGEMERAAKGNQFGQVSIILRRVSIVETKSAVDIERFLEEYASLAKRQYEVLQKSSYAQMPRREAAAYDARFLRIQEISKEIIKLRSEDS